ncbi:MAG: flagellar hook-basal body complex protein FliE [Nitrospirota bacterium]
MDVSAVGAVTAGVIEKPDAAAANGDFKDAVFKSVEGVEAASREADAATADLALDRGENLHKVMIAIEKADVSLQLMIQVRNKVVNAYEDLMKISV